MKTTNAPTLSATQARRLRAVQSAVRGQDLKHAKLLDMDVIEIRSRYRQAMSLRKYIREHLSNAALAREYGMHVSVIEKINTYKIWTHLP